MLDGSGGLGVLAAASGSRGLDELARARLSHGERLRRLRRTRDAGVLTPQEREIAELAAAGLTNREIAARLYVSPRTVSCHLYRTFPKLDIRSRAALRDALDPK